MENTLSFFTFETLLSIQNLYKTPFIFMQQFTMCIYKVLNLVLYQTFYELKWNYLVSGPSDLLQWYLIYE